MRWSTYLPLLTKEEVANVDSDSIFELARRKARCGQNSICCLLVKLFASIGWIYCCPPFPPSIARKTAYAAPKPSSYKLKRTRGRVQFLLCPALVRLWDLEIGDYQTLLARCTPLEAFTPNGLRVCCLHMRSRYNRRPGTTVFYSQGNGTDLGWITFEMQNIADLLGVDVFSYDYAGYGQSEGKFNEKNLCQSASAAFDCLLKKMNCSAERTVVWGMSLGTVATIYLGSKYNVAGVIIQSGFLSSYRYCWPTLKGDYWLDTFCNYKRIKQIDKPTLVVHGEEDQLFQPEHALSLARECPGANGAVVIPGCEHETLNFNVLFWLKIQEFFKDTCTETTTGQPTTS